MKFIKYLSIGLILLLFYNSSLTLDWIASAETQDSYNFNADDSSSALSNILSKDEILLLAEDLITDDFESMENYNDLINLLNSKVCKSNDDIDECWYFGCKKLDDIKVEKHGTTPQLQLFNALRSQFLKVCIVHSILCIVDAGLYFHAETKKDLIQLRAEICQDLKIFKWAIETLEEGNNIQVQLMQKEYCSKKLRMSTHSKLQAYQFIPDFSNNEILKNRLDIMNYGKYLYPKPDFKELSDRVKSTEMNKNFSLVKVLLNTKLSDSQQINKLITSNNSIEKEAGTLLKTISDKIQDVKTEKITEKEVWALICSFMDNSSKLIQMLKQYLPVELNDKNIGGIVSAWLFTITAMKTDNTDNAKKLLDYLKYGTYEDGEAEIIAQALYSKSKIFDYLLDKALELDLYECVHPVIYHIQHGNKQIIEKLNEIEISDTYIDYLKENWEDTKSQKWLQALVNICVNDLNESKQNILLELYDNADEGMKIKIIQALSKYPNLNIIHLIVKELDSKSTAIKTASISSLKNLFYIEYQVNRSDFELWLNWWTNYSDLPGYKEIKRRID